MFFKIGVLRNSPVFTGKHVCWSLFLIQFQALRPAQVFSSEYCEIFTNSFFYRTPRVTSADLLFLIKNNAGWFLLKRFVDLVRVRYLEIIIRNHSSTLLLINLQKRKLVQSKALKQRLFVLILRLWQCR